MPGHSRLARGCAAAATAAVAARTVQGDLAFLKAHAPAFGQEARRPAFAFSSSPLTAGSLDWPSLAHSSRPRPAVFLRGQAGASSAEASTDAGPSSELPEVLRRPRNEILWQMARPTIIISVLRVTYGITDSYWVGRRGAVELEAMGASSFAFWLMLLLGEVGAMGVQALASVSTGAGNRDGVGDAIVQGLWFSLFCGILAVAVIPLIPFYFRLVGIAKPGVLAAGTAYLRGIAWGVIPLTACDVLVSGFKGIAVLGPVLLVNVACVVLNFFLDPLLIWGGYGLPALGVTGAAVATGLGATVATVLSLVLMRWEKIPLRWRRPDRKAIQEIARIGLPVSLGGLLFTAIYMCLGRLLGTLGESNLAALGLGHKVEALAFTVCEGFGAAAITLVGMWLGAGNEARARDAAKHTMKVAVFAMIPLMVPFIFCSVPIVRVFTQDPATVAAAASYLRICGFSFPFIAVEHTMDGALVGAGDTTPSFIFGLVLNLARLPMSLWLAKRYGVSGVWTALAVSTIAKGIAKRWAFNRSRLPLLKKAEALRQAEGAAT